MGCQARRGIRIRKKYDENKKRRRAATNKRDETNGERVCMRACACVCVCWSAKQKNNDDRFPNDVVVGVVRETVGVV